MLTDDVSSMMTEHVFRMAKDYISSMVRDHGFRMLTDNVSQTVAVDEGREGNGYRQGFL